MNGVAGCFKTKIRHAECKSFCSRLCQWIFQAILQVLQPHLYPPPQALASKSGPRAPGLEDGLSPPGKAAAGQSMSRVHVMFLSCLFLAVDCFSPSLCLRLWLSVLVTFSLTSRLFSLSGRRATPIAARAEPTGVWGRAPRKREAMVGPRALELVTHGSVRNATPSLTRWLTPTNRSRSRKRAPSLGLASDQNGTLGCNSSKLQLSDMSGNGRTRFNMGMNNRAQRPFQLIDSSTSVIVKV